MSYSPTENSQALPPGILLQEFEIDRVLGSGGFGITYLAHDTRLSRKVVIKENFPLHCCSRNTDSRIVHPRTSSDEDVEDFKAMRVRFEREAEIVASLDHPGIVRILRSFEAFSTAYFVMPFVEGDALDEVLKQRMARNEPYTETELRELLGQVLDALLHLHAKSIYHRDIKPANILMTREKGPVLIDFGAARQITSELSMTMMESAGYTPFEQSQSKGKIGPWSDIYALAATMIRLITWEKPLIALDRLPEDSWIPLAQRNELTARYNLPFLAAIDRAFASLPKHRWQSAQEWIDAMNVPPATPKLEITTSFMENPQALPPGTRLEEFEIDQVLGAGGFGITYLAHDIRLGRMVVIKENLPVQFAWRDPASLTVAPRHSHGEDADNFAWSLENFSRESAMLASLDHTGIVKVLRSFQAHGTAYFVMPYVDGVAFDELIKERSRKNQPFSEAELRGLLGRVLSALAYLHDRGIYHRDIKPGNILITRAGIPVLIDFGSARQKLSERSMTVVESPGYTPFEQMQSRGNIGPWSDLYAVGGTLCKAITGEHPPKAMDRMMDDPWVPLIERRELSDYSHWFLGSMDRAMSVAPAARWQNAGDWLVADSANPMEERAPLSDVSDDTLGGGHVPKIEEITPAIPEAERALDLEEGQVGQGYRFELNSTQSIVVRYVPGGQFMMGCPLSQAGYGVEQAAHPVTLSHHFWMMDAPVTQGQWCALMGENPAYFSGNDDLPVESVTYSDAIQFTHNISKLVMLPGLWRWRLPTEAQWERACRGGNDRAFSFGYSIHSVLANFDGEYPFGRAPKGPFLSTPSVIRSYPPNAYHLYDMHGNVFEWCRDWYAPYPIGAKANQARAKTASQSPCTDPTGPLDGKNRVARGGSWASSGIHCSSATRFSRPPDTHEDTLGFRIVISRI